MCGGAFRLIVLAGPMLCAGCVFPLHQPKQGKALMQSAAVGHRSDADVTVAIPTRIVEQAAGDLYLNDGLWKSTVSPGTHEFDTLLAANGLRIGIIRGTPPSELQNLMTSDSSVIQPTIRNTTIHKPKVIPVNGPLDRCEMNLIRHLAELPVEHNLQEVESGLVVTASPTTDQKVKLVCEFQVQHGLRQAWLRPSTDGSQLTRQDLKARETYPSFQFEVILDRDEFLIIGPTDDPLGKLGQAFFLVRNNAGWQQRILIVQAGLSNHRDVPSNKSRPIAALVK